MPVALAIDSQLKNFAVIVPTDHDMDSVLFVEFIGDFARPGVFRTNKEQVARELQLMMKAVFVKLVKIVVRP
jgi:hypothetical protein